MKVDFKNMNKWFYAFAGVALLLVGALVAIIILGVNAGKNPPPVELPEDGAESGIYYYDVVEGEIVLSLNSGNKFTIAGPTLNKSGEYTVTDGNLTLDFVRDEDGTATAAMQNGKIVLSYNGATMTFLKKINYTVSFDTDNGSAVPSASVLNGKTASEPAAPTKDGYVFLGWYKDAEYKTLFDFDTYLIGADTTVYARWVEKPVGGVEYVADFEIGEYEGAPSYEDMVTIGGKLYNVPTPTREGYTFGGWFISMYEDGEKLTAAYSEDVVLDANTTLFAVWYNNSDVKLNTPAVSVDANGATWARVEGANSYSVIIKDASGATVKEQTVGTTALAYSFDTLPAGDYTVEVTAISGDASKNSDAAVRYYKNKALGRVSIFNVVDGMLVFGAVNGAEKYLISVDCGNKDHNHVLVDNGESTVYNFKNCSMQVGGIKFVVTAIANGYASSVSEAYVYERNLSSVETITYDPATDSFVWSSVDFATGYDVTVTVGDKTYVFNNGNKTSFSIANYSGDITVSVVPVTEGFNSPAAAVTTTTKTAPATPGNVSANGSIITWDAVAGADSYEIKVGTYTTTVNTNSFDASAVSGLEPGNSYDVQVKAIAGNAKSAYSAPVSVGYLVMDTNVTYKNNTLYWNPVLGVTEYEVRVNGANAFTVSGATSAKVVLTKAGVNKVEVRYTQYGGSSWVGTEVYAYTVTYYSRTVEGGEYTEYLAVGDKMNLLPPDTFVKEGHEFDCWYNAPGAANGNGKPVSSDVFNGSGDVSFWANWTPKTYKVELQIGGFDITNITEGAESDATYTKDFTLPVPVSSNAIYGTFVGWYTGPAGSGTKLTDEKGNSVAAFPYYRNQVAYPFFDTGILAFELKDDGTYAVKRGPAFDSVKDIVIPYTYNGIPVTTILENAFYARKQMETIAIPNTIKLIGTNAFSGTSALKAINVYEVEGKNVEEFYSSYDGALIRHDMGTNYLEVFPRAKTGVYTVPETVNIIRNKAFQYANIEKVIISKSVTVLADQAFYQCQKLKSIEFAGERTAPVEIDDRAFYNCNAVTTIKLPANIAEFDFAVLDRLTALLSIEVEAGGMTYGSVNGWLTNGLGDTVLYTPKTVSGPVEIPVGIRAIGDSAFENRQAITSVVIPSYVNEIGAKAFYNCSALASVTVNGSRNNDLYIGEYAFGCGMVLSTVRFLGNGSEVADTGVINIGAYAFSPFEDYDYYGTFLTYQPALTTLEFASGVNIGVIGDYAFANQTVLKDLGISEYAVITEFGPYCFANDSEITEIFIPKSTQAISDHAFAQCSGVSNIEFAEGGTNISFGMFAFEGCRKLITIELPATVTEFDASAFDGCPAIKEIKVDPDNAYLKSVNGILYDVNETMLLFYPKGLGTSAEDLAKLPWNTITKIGRAAFSGNEALESIEIGAKVTEIAAKAFYNCVNLTGVTFAAGGTALEIGESAFVGTKLSTISLPNYTTVIGKSAFEGVPLTALTLPEELKTIGDNAFKGCSKLAKIVIPNKVETIGNAAFASCSALRDFSFAPGGTADLFIGTLENKTEKNGTFYASKFSSITFPSRLKAIGGYAFSANTVITTIVVPDDARLETIGQYAFNGCTKLKTLSFGPALKTISNYAFYKCNAVTTVNIPRSVTYIGQYAFCPSGSSSSKLTTLTFEEGGTEPLEIASYAFRYVKVTDVTFPSRLGKIYDNITADGKNGGVTAKNFTYIFNGCTSLKNINISGSELYASKDGVLYEVDANGTLTTLLYCPMANEGAKDATGASTFELVIPNTVTSVEPGALYDLRKITTVTFEEFATTDANYGKQILSLGNGIASTELSTAWAVIGGNNNTVVEVNLPSHLAYLGPKAISVTKNNISVNFNKDASNVYLSNYAFYMSKVTTLDLPQISYISDRAFGSCNKLVSVTFDPESTFKSIGASAFASCMSLTSIKIPKTVTYIGASAFQGCSSLAEVDLSEATALAELSERAFYNTALTSFKFPESVEIVGVNLFSLCKNLKTVEFSERLSVAMFQLNSMDTILGSCQSIENVIVPENNPYFVDIDGVLYDKAVKTLYFFPPAKQVETYTIPEGVINVEGNAFYYFSGDEVIFPESVEYIGPRAFFESSIKRIEIPKNVETIYTYTFYSCDLLETVEFADGTKITTIGDTVFYECMSLTDVELPDNITSIGAYAFQNCSSLDNVILPKALVEIPGGLFFRCKSLKNIVLQEGLTVIGDSAFAAWEADDARLESVVVPSTVVSIGGSAFQYNINLKTFTFAEGSALESVGDQVFNRCTKLESVIFPDSVTYMGYGVFAENVSLKSVKLSGGVEEIPDNMFSGCAELESVIIPEGVKRIGAGAFSGNVNSLFPIYLEKLKEITIPSTVEYIGDLAFAGCTSLESVTFADGSKLEKLGESMATENGIFKNTTALKSIVLPTDLQMIGANVFENSAIENITLPASLVSIGNYAFANCDNIKSVDLYGDLVAIGDYAFYDCDSLESATPVFGLEYFGGFAFAECEKITEAFIPASVTDITANPYAGCTGVTSFTLEEGNKKFVVSDGMLYDSRMYTLIYCPNSVGEVDVTLDERVYEIAGGAFLGAPITGIAIPTRISEIPDSAFKNCVNLESVTLLNTIERIGNNAFDGCISLNNVVIPNSVKELGSYAFANCTALNNFTFQDKTDETNPYVIGTHFFEGCTALTQIVLPNMFTVSEEDAPYVKTPTAAIPGYMFANTGIVNAVVPANITDISATGVFMGCAQLKSIEFLAPKLDCWNIGIRYFQNCTAIEEITIPYGTEMPFVCMDRDGGYIFAGCTSLKKVSVYHDYLMPGTATGSHTFEGCTSLKEVKVYLQNCMETEDGNYVYDLVGEDFIMCVDDYSFKDCTSLESIEIGSWTIIYPHAFEGCTSLKTIVFQSGSDNGNVPSLESISDYALAGCTGFENLYIYDMASYGSIGENAFSGWTAEQNIYFLCNTREEIMALTNELSFANCAANIYCKDDIFAQESVTIENCPSFYDGALVGYTNVKELHIYNMLKKATFGASCFEGWGEDQSIYFHNYTAAELAPYFADFALTGCNAKIYDKNGKLITMDAETGNIIGAEGKTLVSYAYAVEELVGIDFTAYDEIVFRNLYFDSFVKHEMGNLTDDGKYELFVGCTAKMKDYFGNEFTVDAATGKLKAYYVTNAYRYEVWGWYEITLGNSYMFDGYPTDLTIYINSPYFTYVDFSEMAIYEGYTTFAGCECPVYDCEGNLVIFDLATGDVLEAYNPAGELIYTLAVEGE